jgi:hypothetical protein
LTAAKAEVVMVDASMGDMIITDGSSPVGDWQKWRWFAMTGLSGGSCSLVMGPQAVGRQQHRVQAFGQKFANLIDNDICHVLNDAMMYCSSMDRQDELSCHDAAGVLPTTVVVSQTHAHLRDSQSARVMSLLIVPYHSLFYCPCFIFPI